MQSIEAVTTWKGNLVKLIVQASYIENGIIYVHFSSEDGYYTESFTLDNLKELKEKTTVIIKLCEEINAGGTNGKFQ